MTLLLTGKVGDLTEVSSATATGEIRKHSHLGWSRKVLASFFFRVAGTKSDSGRGKGRSESGCSRAALVWDGETSYLFSTLI